MAQTPRDFEPCAVAPAFRQRLAAGRENNPGGVNLAVIGDDAKSVGGALDARDTRIDSERRPGPGSFVEERIEDVTGALAVWEQLAVGLFVQSDADLLEKVDGVADWKSAQDAADQRPPASPEIGVRHGDIGDVAARAAADENFRARPPGAVKEQDRAPRVRAPGEDGRGEPGRAGANDNDINDMVGTQASKFSSRF
jgi:hypothetical protein